MIYHNINLINLTYYYHRYKNATEKEEEDQDSFPKNIRQASNFRNSEREFIISKDNKDDDSQSQNQNSNLEGTTGLRHNKSSMIFNGEQVNKLKIKEEIEDDVAVFSTVIKKTNNGIKPIKLNFKNEIDEIEEIEYKARDENV